MKAKVGLKTINCSDKNAGLTGPLGLPLPSCAVQALGRFSKLKSIPPHPNLCKYLNCVPLEDSIGNSLLIVTEIGHKSLSEIIESKQFMEEDCLRSIALQLLVGIKASGLEFCSISPEEIFFDNVIL